MTVISVKEHPQYARKAIGYFQRQWANEENKMVYEDCITHALYANSLLPQWYLLCENADIIGCAGLITNDFISRMDLFPWLCALFIEEAYRGNSYGALLIERACMDAKTYGFQCLYLCTDHIGYYEKFGFQYIGVGYHPWGGHSRIYQRQL